MALKLSFRHTLILILAAFFCSATAYGQSDAQFSQYYVVKNYYNPAAIGTSDFLNIRAGARMQWVGITNAPQTFAGVAEMPFKLAGKRFGVGLLVQQDNLGLYKSLNVGAQLGYKLKLFKGELTIGAQVGYLNQAFKGSDVVIPDNDDYHQSTDDAIPKQDLNGNALDFSAGLYYTRSNWWLGASVAHVTQPTVTFKSENGGGADESMSKNYEFSVGRTLYLMAGCNIPIKNTLFEVMPSIMAKTDFTFYTGEATVRLRYNKFIYGGVGYRYNDALIVTLGAEYKGLFIGYAYDYALSAIAKASSGSHEVFAGYSLKLDFSDKNKNKHKSIRIL